MIDPVFTAQISDNNEVLRDALTLYLPQPSLIADVCYGKGAFWNGHEVDLRPVSRFFKDLRGLGEYRHAVFCSDLNPEAPWPATPGIDCRRLPYHDGSLDGVVFDPPYAGTGGTGANGNKKSASACIDGYGNDFLGSRSVDVILELYYRGIVEHSRVLKQRNGILIVKSMDQIESGKQRFLTDDIIHYCTRFPGGWTAMERFVVINKRSPTMRHAYQLHARKNHSELLVFRNKYSRMFSVSG